MQLVDLTPGPSQRARDCTAGDAGAHSPLPALQAEMSAPRGPCAEEPWQVQPSPTELLLHFLFSGPLLPRILTPAHLPGPPTQTLQGSVKPVPPSLSPSLPCLCHIPNSHPCQGPGYHLWSLRPVLGAPRRAQPQPPRHRVAPHQDGSSSPIPGIHCLCLDPHSNGSDHVKTQVRSLTPQQWLTWQTSTPAKRSPVFPQSGWLEGEYLSLRTPLGGKGTTDPIISRMGMGQVSGPLPPYLPPGVPAV